MGKDKLLVVAVGSTLEVIVAFVVLVVEAISLINLLVGLSQSISTGALVPSLENLGAGSSEFIYEILS